VPCRIDARREGGVDLGVLTELEAMGLVTLADNGYQGSTHTKAPTKADRLCRGLTTYRRARCGGGG
jgi:hypothetical protein